MSARWINIDPLEKSLYDAFFFFTQEQTTQASNLGFNAFYMPHAVNHYVFRPIKLTASEGKYFSSDVIFVGGWKRPRQMVINAIINQPLTVKVYGPGWLKRNLFNTRLINAIKGNSIYGDTLVKSYIGAKIVLNINAWFTEKTYGINQRVFDIPACGAFLLTDYMEELDSFFKPGKEIETYKDIEELIDKLRFYIKNDNHRERIARAGYERSQKLQTWITQANKMMQLLKVPPFANK